MEIYVSLSGLPETINVLGKLRPTRNSDGEFIANSVDSIKNFWLWFEGSRAVDSQKRPLVFYHGTDSRFDVFRAKDGLRGNALTGELRSVRSPAFFFTTNEIEAKSYGANKNSVAHYVMPVYLKILWLARVRNFSDIEEYVDDTEEKFNLEEKEFWQYVEDPKFIKRFTSDWGEGFSGICYDDRNAYDPEWVVYNPAQIKSIQNSGSFNPRVLSIYE